MYRASTGRGNSDYKFSDVRYEMRGSNKSYVKSRSTAPIDIKFVDVVNSFDSGGSRDVVDIEGEDCNVRFIRSIINSSDFTYRVSANSTDSGGAPIGCLLEFDGCRVPTEGISHRITTIGNMARAVSTGSRATGPSGSAGLRFAYDFDYNFDLWAEKGPPSKIKQFALHLGSDGDFIQNTALRSEIPIGATIKSVFIQKTSDNTGNSGEVTFKLGNETNNQVIYDSGALLIDSDIKIYEHLYGKTVYGRLNLWAEPTNTNVGIQAKCYIEYI